VWCCSRRNRPTRATSLHAVAAVRLVSVQAASGEVDAALRGYEELVDYRERTGAWTQQWTTVRNLADLLDLLDDHDAASFLRVSADEAPEASSIAIAGAEPVTARIDPSHTKDVSAISTREPSHENPSRNISRPRSRGNQPLDAATIEPARLLVEMQTILRCEFNVSRQTVTGRC
jgi:hypothetical protein